MAPSSFGAWGLVALVAASTPALAEHVLVATPESVTVDATTRRTHERSVQLGNSGSQSLVVDLSIRLAGHRRLSGGQQEETPGLVEEDFGERGFRGASPAASAVRAPAAETPAVTAPQRSLSSEGDSPTGCSGLQRLLLRVRPPPGQGASIPASRRLASQQLARRLQDEVEGLNGSSWKHLAALGIDIAELDCNSRSTPEEVLAEVQKGYGKQLEFAELDKRNIVPFSSLPGTRDPHWSSQWGMRKIKAEESWAVLQHRMAGAQATVVAVLDTGVDWQHEDLLGHIWVNPGEEPGNGIDDDNNGLIDDVHGWDYFDNDNDPSDSDGHGTHCAGVIAASGGNGIGIEGVAGHLDQVKVMPLRFLGPGGGSTSDAVLALNYAVAMGAQISSNSWGGSSNSAALSSAILTATQGGHVFVAAAGNEGSNNEVTAQYPCCYSNVLCVAATTSNDGLASYSNYGPQWVDIAAPGSAIHSTWPRNRYHSISGTSMATPHVTGAVALIWSTLGGQLSLSMQEVEGIAKETAASKTWLQGKVSSGMLDLHAMALRAEHQAWIQFLPPSGDTSEGGVSELSLTIPPSGSANFQLRIDPATREVGDHEATVLASCEACGPDLEVAVIYRLAGVPSVKQDLLEAALDWGDVLANAQSRRTLTIKNRGNGSAQLKFEDLIAPFSGPTEVVTVLPQATVHLGFLCTPPSVGSWQGNAVVRSNEGLEAFDAREPDAWRHGTAFPLALACRGKAAPSLELDAFSGLQLWPESGPVRHIEPSIPAEWESLVVDPTDSAANVTGRLALVHSSNFEGCHGHSSAVEGLVVLVKRGTCTFQQKADLIAQAGGIGMIVYDNVDETAPLKMMGLADHDTPPSLPAFLVTREEGLALKGRLEQGELLHVSLVRRPLVLITHHPLHGIKHYELGQLPVRNTGEMELHWRAMFAPFNYDWDDFYEAIYAGAPSNDKDAPLPPPPPFEWTPEHTLGDIPHFAGHDIDDSAAEIQLPFHFPFYGATREAAHVNSNGFLSLDPDYSPGLDHTGHLGSIFAPNGLIAPFWTDLVCRSSQGCRIRAGLVGTDRSGDSSCASSESMVVQYKDIQHYALPSYQRASFEARLYSTGCIEMMYKDLPYGSCSVSVGVETVAGLHGQDLAHKLQLRSAQSLAVQLVPWLTPRGPVAQISPPGGLSSLAFAVEGSKSRQGWIEVIGEEEGSSWRLERHTRVVQRVFGYAWHVGPWGLCRRPTCEPSDGNDDEDDEDDEDDDDDDDNHDDGHHHHEDTGTQTRSVSCRGSDGVVYDDAMCGSGQECVDDPLGWRDSWGDSCRRYKRKAYCTPSGGYGSGWLWYWGTFEDYRNQGHIAPTACCACGGGQVTSSRPAETRACSPTEAGPDEDGDGHDDCVERTTSSAEITTSSAATSLPSSSSTSFLPSTSSSPSSSSSSSSSTTVDIATTTAAATSPIVTTTTAITGTTSTAEPPAPPTSTTRLSESTSTSAHTGTSTSESESASTSTLDTTVTTGAGSVTATAVATTVTSTSVHATTGTVTVTTVTATAATSTLASTTTATTTAIVTTATVTATSATTTALATTATTSATSTVSTLTKTTGTTVTTATTTTAATSTTTTAMGTTRRTTTTTATTMTTTIITTTTVAATSTTTLVITTGSSTTAATVTETLTVTTVTATSTATTSTASVTATTHTRTMTATTSTPTTTITATTETTATTATTATTRTQTTTVTTVTTTATGTTSTASTTATTATQTVTATTGTTTGTMTATSTTPTTTTATTATTTKTTTATTVTITSTTATTSVTTTTGTSTGTTVTTTVMTMTMTNTATVTTTSGTTVTTTTGTTTYTTTTKTTTGTTLTTTATSTMTTTSLTTQTTTTTLTETTTTATPTSTDTTTTVTTTGTTLTTTATSTFTTTTLTTHTTTTTLTGTTTTATSTSTYTTSTRTTTGTTLTTTATSTLTTTTLTTHTTTTTLTATTTTATSTSTDTTTTRTTTGTTRTTTATSTFTTTTLTTHTTTTTVTGTTTTATSTSTDTTTTRTTTGTTRTTTATSTFTTTTLTTRTTTTTSTETSTTATSTSTATTVTGTTSTTTVTTSVTSLTTTTSTTATTVTATVTGTTTTTSVTTGTSTTSTRTTSTTVTTLTTTVTATTITTSSSTTSATSSTSTTTITATTLTTTVTVTTVTTSTSTTSETTLTSTSSSTVTATTTTTSATTTSTVTQTSTTRTTVTITTTVTTITVTTVTFTTTTRTQTTSTVTTTLGPLFPVDPGTGEIVEVDSISDPTPTEVAKSSVLVVGPTEPSEALETSLEQALATELNVEQDQVTVTEFKVTKAALLDSADAGGARRLSWQDEINTRGLSSLQDALQADFEVSVHADPVATTGSQAIDVVVASLEAVKSNPSGLLSSFGAMLERDNIVLPQSLRMRVATPTVSESSARLVVSKWMACGADVEVCVPSEPPMRHREIMCVDAEDLYKKLKPFSCSGLATVRSEEPCPSGLPRPPPCGWSTSSWSECTPQGTPLGTFCPPGGTGIQQREVVCLTEGSFSACTDTPPDSTQDCTCLDTSLGDQTDPGPPLETSVLISEGGGNMMGMAGAGAGVLALAALGGGFWFSCKKQRGSKHKLTRSKHQVHASPQVSDMVMEDIVSVTLAATGAPSAAGLVQQHGLREALSPRGSPRLPCVTQVSPRAAGETAPLESATEGNTKSSLGCSTSEVPTQWGGSHSALAADPAQEVEAGRACQGDRRGPNTPMPYQAAVCQASPTSTVSTCVGSPPGSSSLPSPAGSACASVQDSSTATPTASLGKAWSPPVVLAGHVQQPLRHLSSPSKPGMGPRTASTSRVAASRAAWQDQTGSTSGLGAAALAGPAHSQTTAMQPQLATNHPRPQGRRQTGVRVTPA